MFKGFINVPLPVYDVIVPQTLLSFSVRSMTVQEEERLKSSLVVPTRITEHLNRCIFDLIVKKPEEIKDYKTFERLTTPRDREALLFGVYHVSYGDLRNYDVSCKTCEKTYPVSLDIANTFNITPYSGKEILKKRIKVLLKVFKGVVAIIKQPSLADELAMLSAFGGSPDKADVVADIVCIESFKQELVKKKDGGEVDPILVTEKSDILDAFMTLNPRDRRLISDKYDENFGKYRIELKMKSFCPFCKSEQESNIDIVQQFFRMVWGAA